MGITEGGSGHGDFGSPLSGWKGRRAVLRAGFGCVIALLVFSTIEAYRIQESVSGQHLGIHRTFVHRDEALSQLRRNVLLGSTFIRDFFLSTRADRVSVYESQIRELQEQNRQALAVLENLRTAGRAEAEARSTVEDYWRTLEPVAVTMEFVTAASAYDFVQREVVPRRSAAYWGLRQLTEIYHQDLQDREAEVSRKRRAAAQRLALLLGVCVVLGVLAAWLAMRHVEVLARATARQYGELARAKRELQQLSARLLEVQEEERRQLSHGLHDEIGQTLTALRIEVSNALQKSVVPEVKERLDRARALAERSVQAVRDISLLLRPSLLDDLGLLPALQWQAEDFARRSGIACEFEEAELPETLPDGVKTCVYRVVQEALNNCEKHAGASRVWLRLRAEPRRLTVEVRDNGRGFEAAAGGMPRSLEGVGLLGMRERASRLGGQVTCESAPGRGTRVTLELPLPAPPVKAHAAGAAVPERT